MTDYLKERREKRQQEKDQERGKDWASTLQNKRLSKKEKFLRIKEKAREIEEMALRKEQLLLVKGSGDNYQVKVNSATAGGNGEKSSIVQNILKDDKNIEETLEVNEMLIDAIKAKLAILDNIN